VFDAMWQPAKAMKRNMNVPMNSPPKCSTSMRILPSGVSPKEVWDWVVRALAVRLFSLRGLRGASDILVRMLEGLSVKRDGNVCAWLGM